MLLTHVALIIVEAPGSFLLMRRAPTMHTFPGAWNLPGGRSEPGERSVDTAVRELNEETGFKCSARDLRHLGRYYLGHLRASAYLLRVTDVFKPVMGDSEHDAFKWVELTEKAVKAQPMTWLSDRILTTYVRSGAR